MNKKRLLFFLIFFAPCLVAANTAMTFIINGISDKVLLNVEKRLDEWQQLKSSNEQNIEELHTQVINALQPFAYFKASVNINVISTQKTQITINPGPQTYITSLDVYVTGEGQFNPLIQKALKNITIKVGDPLLTPAYNKAKQSLMNAAQNAGYLHASFTRAEILIDEHNSAKITLIFNTGMLFYFGKVAFNPTTLNPGLLHRFVPFKYNQPYSTEQILKLNNDLSNSGYFSSVLVKPNISNEKQVPVNINLTPVSKYSYSLSGGYGTDTGARGRAGLYVTPVNQMGHKFNAIAQGSFTQNALQAQYLVPGQNPVADQYSLTGNFSNLNYDTGYSNALLLSLAQQHSVDYFKRALSINALYESFNYSQQPHSYEFMLYPKAKFTFSKTTNPLFSPSGYNLTLSTLGAGKITLSQISFAQGSLDAKAAYMFEPMRLRFYAHLIEGVTGIKDINQLPLSLALLLGGTDNMKAFSFNSIGPGKIISYGGFELQKEVVKNWYVIALYDAGDVYNPGSRLTQYDLGAALMWVSPVGPIKLGLAQEVHNNLQRLGTNPRLIISMGPDL